MRRLFIGFFVFSFLGLVVAEAQETPNPTEVSPPAKRSVRLSFLPPPLDGTISLGVYDASGKLVRVLHREAAIEDFTIGDDALSTIWNGKDDAGQDLPSGKYTARGFLVGELKVAVSGYYFNDWVVDATSPRLREIENLSARPGQQLALLVTTAAGSKGTAICDASGKVVSFEEARDSSSTEVFETTRRTVRIEDGKLLSNRSGTWEAVSWQNLIHPISAASGSDIWVIDRNNDGSFGLKQFSKDGEFQHELKFGPDEPAPKLIEATETDGKIFLLEQDPSSQRLRGLTIAPGIGQGPSAQLAANAKVDFEKRILAHKDFGIANGKPAVAGGVKSETIQFRLQPNPLLRDQKITTTIGVGFDEKGSYLKTADGLPLRTISQTRNVARALVALSGRNELDVFQDDTAVVEHLRITRADEMMSFDCGEFVLK